LNFNRKKYQQSHEASGKDLSEYFELRSLLQQPQSQATTSTATAAILNKMKQKHANMLNHLVEMRSAVLSMHQVLHGCKRRAADAAADDAMPSSSSSPSIEGSIVIEMMESQLSMLDADMDMKELLLCSLCELLPSLQQQQQQQQQQQSSATTDGAMPSPTSSSSSSSPLDALHSSIMTSCWQRMIMQDEDRLHERVTRSEALLEQLQDRAGSAAAGSIR
jgi:hypothetical protein